MNILVIGLIILLIWRMKAGSKKGVVREVIALVNVIFAGVLISLISMIVGAYHSADYLKIVILVVIVIVLSVIYGILNIVFFPAKVVSKLPIVSTADKILGLAMGAAETFVVFWTICCICNYAEFASLSGQIMPMIFENPVLVALYEHNMLAVLLDIIKASI